MRPSFALTTPPSVEPVTLAEAKAHTRVEHSGEDALFERLIAAARRHVEQATGLALITQTWTATWSTWPGRARGLPLRPAPVAALTSLTVAGVASDAFVLRRGRPAFAVLLAGRSEPPLDAELVATFTAGFGADASAVPEDLKQAILLLVGHWYENREPTISGTITNTIPLSVGALIAPYCGLRLA